MPYLVLLLLIKILISRSHICFGINFQYLECLLLWTLLNTCTFVVPQFSNNTDHPSKLMVVLLQIMNSCQWLKWPHLSHTCLPFWFVFLWKISDRIKSCKMYISIDWFCENIKQNECKNIYIWLVTFFDLMIIWFSPINRYAHFLFIVTPLDCSGIECSEI